MKIIEQSHEILSVIPDVEKSIEIAGRTCYKSEEKITDHTALNFTRMLRDRGHHAMLEFGDATVKFITNRGVTHEKDSPVIILLIGAISGGIMGFLIGLIY